MVKIIRIATRSSPLAVIQAKEVGRILENNGYKVEYIKTKSKGDIDRKSPLYKINSTGVFVKSVDELLLNSKADISVHSAKDVPSEYIFNNKYISVFAIPKRKDPRECFVSKKYNSLYEIRRKGVVGSSSIRRINFIKNIRSDVRIKNIRGNVDTRVSKIMSGEYDGTIMAKVGLERLNMENVIKYVFDIDELTPPPGQGALIITVNKNIINKIDYIRDIVNDYKSYLEVMYEKIILYRLGSGCSIPIGVNCNYKNGYLKVTSMVCLDDKILIRKFNIYVDDEINEENVLGVIKWLRKYT